jgi:hypothetical protein
MHASIKPLYLMNERRHKMLILLYHVTGLKLLINQLFITTIIQLTEEEVVEATHQLQLTISMIIQWANTNYIYDG